MRKTAWAGFLEKREERKEKRKGKLKKFLRSGELVLLRKGFPCPGSPCVDSFRSNIVGWRAGHAAAPTLRNDTASRPSSVAFGATFPYTPGGKRIAGGRCGERKENSEKGREKRTRQAAIFLRKSPPALVRATGLEPARFWQWNLNPPSLPIPPCPHTPI